MEFYLVRHGEAKSEAVDPLRPLTEAGKRDVEKVAQDAVARQVRIFEILHSDKLRAKETAVILARYLSPLGGLRETKNLGPENDPSLAQMELESALNPLMMVGHLPHLSRLVSMLIWGNPEREMIEVPAGAILCLSYDDGKWKQQWKLAPAMIC